MQDYGFVPSKPKKSLPLKGLLLIIFFVILTLGFLKRNQTKDNQIISPLPETIISFFSQKPKDTAPLLSEIKKLIEKAGGTWSVYIYDLTSNQGFGINETMIFKVASVNKIPILASLYYSADKGEVNLDQQVTLQAEDIQDYGTGSIRYDPLGTTYSVKTLARLMMEKSDNTAAYILGRQIMNFEKIQKLVNDWGLTQTDMENDKTSLLDMARLLGKIYRGEITNQALTLEMLTFMDESDFEDRIPAQLPKEIKVYHKTGDGIGAVHDVGIIDLAGHPYVLGVFTADINGEAETRQTMAQVSKMVFEFMKW